MTEKQLAEIIGTLNEKDRIATEALARANRQFSSGLYDDAQASYDESAGAREYRNGIIDTLAVLGYVVGIARNTGTWIVIRKEAVAYSEH